MEVIISNVQQNMKLSPQMKATVKAVLNKAAEVYDVSAQAEVGFMFADDSYIQELNLRYRGKDTATDVLSFALNEGEEPEIIGGYEGEELLGDIVISVETMGRQAEEYGHSVERELAFLTLHGMLHLLGYDHESEEERQEMRKEEEYVLSLLGIVRNE